MRRYVSENFQLIIASGAISATFSNVAVVYWWNAIVWWGTRYLHAPVFPDDCAVSLLQDRPPCIPEAVLKRKQLMEVEGQSKRKLERQIEEEMGDEYVLDLQSKAGMCLYYLTRIVAEKTVCHRASVVNIRLMFCKKNFQHCRELGLTQS